MKKEKFGVHTPSVFTQPDEKIKLNADKRIIRDNLPRFLVYLYADFKFHIEKLRDFKQLRNRFNEKVGYPLDLKNPRTYNEKINWKKIYDRNPLLTVTADKYEVRSYLKSVLGEQEAEKYLIPLYFVTRNPKNIPFDDLPDSFVIKPNHGSRMHLIVRNKSELVIGDVIAQCNDWLKVHYGLFNHEWAYKHIKRKIIIEKLLLSENNELPCDYRFFCFHGVCRFIRSSNNRFSGIEQSSYFDINWNPLQVHNPGYAFSENGFEKPSRLTEMIQLAEKISKAFDSVRVDLYYSDENIYFSELTHYRSNGMARFEPQSYDLEFGEYWNLKENYWKKG